MQTTSSHKKDHKALYRHALAFGLAAFIFIFTLALFGIRYYTNDDATLANIAAGAYGDSLHMVYVNVLFAFLLRPLYLLVPHWNWYVLVQIGLMFVAAVLLIDLALEKLGTAKGVILTALIALPFSYILLQRFQYVHTSGFLLCTGLILIAVTLGKPSARTVCGILLALLGSMLRWPNFLAMGGLSAALLLGYFFRLDKEGKKKSIVTMLVLFALVFGAKGFDSWYYKQDPDWKYFTEYNEARTAFSDYAVYHIEGDTDEFCAEGIFSPLESTMMMRWDYYDPAVYTPEKVEAAAASIPRRPLTSAVKETVKTGVSLLYGTYYHWLVAALALYALFCVKFNKKALPLWGTIAMFGLLLFYLKYLNRFPSYVEAPLLLALILYSICCLGLADHRTPVRTEFLAALLVFMVIQYPAVFRTLRAEAEIHKERKTLEEVYFEEMNEDKDHLYLLSTEAITVCSGLDVAHPRPENFYSNVVHYGGWLSGAPTCKEAMAHYGVTRPIVDAVDNPAVYLGYHGIEHAAAYASEQLGCPVEAVNCGPNAFAPYQLRRVTETPAS